MKRAVISILVLVIFSLAACVHAGEYDLEKRGDLSSDLARLSRYVDNKVYQYGNPGGLSDRALLERYTQDRPDLLTPFDGYVLHAKVAGDNVVVLLCSPEGKALLEDVGATAKMECPLWDSGRDCGFSDNMAVCQ